MRTPKIMESGSFQFNSLDFQRWGKNTLIFLSPALLVFLLEIQKGKTPQEALVTFKVWGLGVLIDFLRKFIKDNTK